MNLNQILKSLLNRMFWRSVRLRKSTSVLLTFDDGPDPLVTPQVLERLRTHHARAMFFVVGNRIPKAPELLPKILAEGHVLGNHSYSHWLGKAPGPLEYYRDLQHCQARIKSLTNQVPQFYRAPLGYTSVASLIVPRYMGMRQLLWSQDENDWMLRNAEAAVEVGHKLALKIRPGDIVLLHDDNPWVITVLDILLPQLTREGYDMYGALEEFQPALTESKV